jgi:hypothetical protein
MEGRREEGEKGWKQEGNKRRKRKREGKREQ